MELASLRRSAKEPPPCGISARGIAPHLAAGIDPGRICVRQTLESTNKTAREMLLSGAPAGTVVLAEEQSAGRGRFGRAFFSPRGGVYASFILKAPADAGAAQLVTVFAAVAACQAIEAHTGGDCSIKWVNDVLAGGRKVCGILAEAVAGAGGSAGGGRDGHVILGIGVNINIDADSFPEDIRGTAGSLSLPQERLCPFAAGLINRVAALCGEGGGEGFGGREGLGGGEAGRAAALDEYRRRSCVTGRDVYVLGRGGEKKEAAALGIDGGGGLVVRYADGTLETLSSGEISIRPVPVSPG
ncbi:MAG: biotin--[acetyl-CoA-carboxylase] ligase [Clostridiales Family XIII bacterium]|jgi:BirA family biotin operon repressor/biotin-[acetyl-CoA-carboxylase] ligase|nr:biotin--[acetyl-CoA-carboxylase] ligase [Clostridiales Family XIII bacterium]